MATQLSLNELLAGLEAKTGVLRQKLVLAMIDEGMFRQDGGSGEIRFAGDRMRPEQMMRIVMDCYAAVLVSVYDDAPESRELPPATD